MSFCWAALGNELNHQAIVIIIISLGDDLVEVVF